MNKQTARKKLEISAYYLFLRDDNILYSRVKEYAVIDLKEAIEMTDAIQKLSPDLSYPLLVNMGRIKFITKEARDYFRNGERKPTSPAVALVTETQLSTIIGNFYLLFDKPLVPTRLFRNESKAVEWLKKFL